VRHLAIAAALAGLVVPCAAGDGPALPGHLPDPGGRWACASGPDPAGTRPVASRVSGAAAATCADFNSETFCSTGWGWQWFGVRVAGGIITFRAWSNLFNVPSPCPLSFTFHFGDGTSETAPGNSTGSGSFVSLTHKYEQAGTYTISITASDGASTISCTMTTINVSACWQDGLVCYQGDNLTWNRPPPYTFGALDADPPVRVNGTMVAAGHSRVEYTYAGNVLTSSTYKPGGRVYVPAAGGDVELFASPPPAFSVLWNAGTMQPLAPPLTLYSWAGGGLPLWLGEGPLALEPAALLLSPLGIIGVPGTLELARYTSSWRLAAGAPPQFLAMALKAAEVTPSLSIGALEATYAPPPQDVLDVSASLQFPFSQGPSFAAAFQHRPCGLNKADVTLAGLFGNDVPIAAVGPVTLGIAGWRSALDHVCDGEGLAVLLGGSLEVAVAGVEIPGEYFSIDDVSLKYEHPHDFEIQGGTAKVLGFPVANVHGHIRAGTPPYRVQVSGSVDLAGALVGRVTEMHSLDSSRISGNAVGVGRIPEFSCSWWNQPCTVVRALARAALGPLPYEVQGQSLFAQGSVDRASGAWQGTFMTEYAVRSITLSVVVEAGPGGTTVLVGDNLGNLFELGASPQSVGALAAAAERGVELPAGLPGVVFAATGRTAVPASFALRGPSGRTLTLASPGPALCSSSAAEGTVLCEVPYPEAGTWTLSADGLPAADIALFALAPRPRPALAFTRVEHGGGSVEIEATVEPASPTATVRFSYGATGAGGLGEAIGEPLSAASGSVAATWDVAALPPGTYYLFAEAAEPGALPTVTYADAPITIAGASPLDAPSALSGTRDGDTATLAWTPSTAPEAVAHAILYTDDAAVPGYPTSRAATAPGAATLAGLAPERSYRFAVAAVDADGILGPLSNELTLAGTAGSCVLTCGASAPAAVAEREPAPFLATISAASCGEPVVVEWTFGDGGSARGAAASHAFAASGSFDWRATARSGAVACESAGTIAVTAGEAAPRRRLRRHLDPLP